MSRAYSMKLAPESTGGLPKRLISGFSFTEMIVTMFILTLTATLMATGIPVAIDTYKKIEKTSNAQLALSTTIEVLRSEIDLSTDVRVEKRTDDAENKIYYLNPRTGYWCSIGNPDNSDAQKAIRGLVKQVYIGTPTSSDGVNSLKPYTVDGGSRIFAEPLLTNEAITTELIVRLDESKIKRPNNTEVDIVLYVQDIGENRLAIVGEGEGYTADGYRILTRLAS